VRLQSPKSLRVEMAEWLKAVNKGKVPAQDSLKFSAPTSSDVLGETLSSYTRSISPRTVCALVSSRPVQSEREHVRLIMDRLSSLEPMPESNDGSGLFPAHVNKGL